VRRRRDTTLGIAVMPFLVCLLAVAGYHLVGNMGVAAAKRRAVDACNLESGIRKLKEAKVEFGGLRKAESAADKRCQELDAQLRDLGSRRTRLRVAAAALARFIQTCMRELRGMADPLARAVKLREQRQQAFDRVASKTAELTELKEDVVRLDSSVAELRATRADRKKRRGATAAEIADLEARLKKTAVDTESARHVSATEIAPNGINARSRPILFAECARDGLRLMPANKVLSGHAANDAKKEFLKRARAAGLVVFLIRPSGFGVFGRYRKALLTWNRSASRKLDWGFEAIDSDWLIAYGEENRS
jgi:hypothetical protein